MPDWKDFSNTRSLAYTGAYSRPLLSVVYLAGVTWLLFAMLSNRAYDDPFITYRYAHNLARGLGFVYNPGERILSTTTPFFAILLTLLSFVSSDLPRVANLIGAFSLALGGLLLWDLSCTWKTPFVGWTALLLYPSFTLPALTLGSEIPLYIAISLGAFAAYARKRYFMTAILAAIVTLTRHDGLLVPLVLILDYVLRIGKPIPWKAIMVFIGLLLPWLLFAWIYFGYPLPITLLAKRQQGTMAVSQTFAPGFLWILGWYQGGWQYWLEALLALLGIYWLARFARQWFLLLSWNVLYFGAYTLLGVSRYFWYYAPLVPGFIVLVGLGVSAIGQLIPQTLQRLRISPARQSGAPGLTYVSAGNSTGYLLAGALIIALATAQILDLRQLSAQPDQRAIHYRRVAVWLNQNTPPDALIGSLEVGILGYYTDRRFVDFAGLIHPEVAQKLGNSANYDEPANWAAQVFSPDYIVVVKGDLEGLVQGYIQRRCRVAENYQPASDGYSESIAIYHCQQ